MIKLLCTGISSRDMDTMPPRQAPQPGILTFRAVQSARRGGRGTSGYHSSSVPFSTLSTVSSGDSAHHETRTKCHDSWACRSVFRLHHKTRKDHGRGQLTPIADLCLLDGLFLCSRDRMEHERSALDQPPPSQQRAPRMRGRRPGGGRSE